MVSCVLRQEMLFAGRRRRDHVLRWIYIALVAVQVVPLLFAEESFNQWLTGGGFSDFFERFLVLHFGLIALLTPAMVGGAITDEKTSGTLQYLLTAYLSPWEIVLGKLLARSYQIVLMSLAGLPLICLFSGFGGVGSLPVALLALSLPLIFALAAASILASVWCRTTRDALLSVYSICLMVLALAVFFPGTSLATLSKIMHPLQALSLENGGVRWPSVGRCVMAWSLAGVFCLMVATLRLRGAYLRQLRAAPARTWRWLPARRPRIGANPVLWRERHVVGLAVGPWLRRWPRWIGCCAVAMATLFSLAMILESRIPKPGAVAPPGKAVPRMSVRECAQRRAWTKATDLVNPGPANVDALYWHGLAALVAVTFVVAARASGCVAEEREKDTWQPLLQTPLTTRMIVRGKQWGILGAGIPYLAAYALVAIPGSMLVGTVATAWTILWLVATLFAAIFVTAVGIWCSARFSNSWLSMLATVAITYLSWIAITGPVALALCFVQGLAAMVLGLAGWLFAVGDIFGSSVQGANATSWSLALGFVAAFLFLTHRLLAAAEKQINKRDRAKEVDPQYQQLHERWLRHIELTAGVPKPLDPALEAPPLPLAVETVEERPPVPVPPEPREDTDALLPVPPAFRL